MYRYLLLLTLALILALHFAHASWSQTGTPPRRKTPIMTSEDLPARGGQSEKVSRQVTDMVSGGDLNDLLFFELSLPSETYTGQQQRSAFVRQVIGRIRALAQVESAAVIDVLPQVVANDASPPLTPAPQHYAVTPDFFRVARLPLLSGRSFTERDDADHPGVIVLSASLARALFPDTDPIGKRVPFPLGPHGDSSKEVVGVVDDVRDPSGRRQADVYVPYSQEPALALILVVRGKSPLERLSERLKEEVRKVDAQVVASPVQQ